jgi:hypothetical protein
MQFLQKVAFQFLFEPRSGEKVGQPALFRHPRLSPPKSGAGQLKCLGSNLMPAPFIGELAGEPVHPIFYSLYH